LNEDIIIYYDKAVYTSTWAGSCYNPFGCPVVGFGFSTNCGDGSHVYTSLYYQLGDYYGYCTKNGQTIRIREISSNTDPSQYDIDILYVPDTVEADDKNKGMPDNGICTDPRNIFAGNPVNVGTGNKFEDSLDISVTTPGVPLEFRRYYNSKATSDGPLGYGWTHSFSLNLQVVDTNPPARIKITDADGRALYFRQVMYTYADGTHFAGESGVKDRLVLQASGQYLLRRKEGNLTYQFDFTGKLTQISDPNNNTLTFAYTNNLLTQVSNNFGKALTIQYSGGRISSVTDPKGQSVVYNYNANGDLTSVSYPDANSIAYAYANHQLTDKYDTGFNLIGHWGYDANGRVSAYYRYLNSGNPQESINFTYGTTSTVLTRSTGTTTYTTAIGDGIRVVTAIEGCGETCGGGIHKSFQYDSRLNLTHVTLTSEGQQYTTRYTYDTGGLLYHVGEIIETREALGSGEERARTYSYTHRSDDPFLLTQSTETKPSVASSGQNKVTTTAYNNQGRITSVTETGYILINGTPAQTNYATGYQYNSFGQLTGIDGPRTDVSDTIAFEYYENASGQGNNRAQPKAVVNALNQRTEFSEYDANGNVGAITDPNGVITRFTYDARNRIRTSRNESTQAEIQFFYDARGSISSIISPEGNRIDFTYNLADRLTEIKDSANNRIVYGYNAEGNRVSEAIYDPQNALRKSLSFTYDAYNRLLKVINPDQSYTEYTYDDKGNRKAVRDPRVNITQLGYDALDRLRTISQPLSIITDQGFDAHDNLASVMDPNEHTTAYQADDFGRRNVTSSPDTGITRYLYDPAGNLTQQTDGNGNVVDYTYDAVNRVTSIQFQDPTRDITYVYDSPSVPYGIGRLTGRTDPSGAYTFSYDAQGNMVREDKTISGVLYTTQYLYNKNNALSSVTYPSGRTVTYTRNSIGRITQVNATISGNHVALASSITSLPFGPLTGLAYGNGLSLMKDYDNQYRVSSIAAGSVLSLVYQYSLDGNILSISDALNPTTSALETSGDYAYEEGSNVLASISGPQPATFVSDNNGNIVSENTRAYAYDPLNRLITVSEGGTQIASYTYNGLNQRTKKTTQAGTIIYHYDPQGRLVAETDNTGQALVEYIYLDDEPLAMIRDESVFYYHTDHLGTPQVMTDANGTVVWSALYSPFGNATVATSTIENNLRFPGQYYDAETGLHYNYFRYYNPRTGRYITADPIGLMGGVNLYGYAGGDPINWIDPWGLARYVIIVGDQGLGAHNVGSNFNRVANTRANELRLAGHTVDIVRASNVADFNNAITAGNTIDGAVIYYGHGWNGVLYIGHTSTPSTNLDKTNVSLLSNRNLDTAARIELNACNSGSAASEKNYSIAQLVAIRLARNTSGWNRPLGFTGTPGHYLHGTNAFPPTNGPLYIVPTPGGRLITFNP